MWNGYRSERAKKYITPKNVLQNGNFLIYYTQRMTLPGEEQRGNMGVTGNDNRLADLLNMDRLQTLLDNLAKALDLAFVAVDYRGRPVTESCGFTDFCKCMQNHGQLCSQCYAHGGLHATMAGQPYVYRCHTGLVEFAVPLMVDGKYMGAVMGGQCELVGEAPALSPVLPQSTPWEQDAELSRTRSSVHKTSYDKLEAGIRLVQDILRNLLEEEQSRAAQEELRSKNRELLEEKAARVNLELAMKIEEDSGKFVEKLDSEHLFYMLNVISRLAFLEKAEETERTACDFASMMRYVLENGGYNCVTLGEELEYIDYYLQIQRRRTEGRLHYEISVPDKYHSTLCPFMLLHPLIKNTVKYVLDNSRDGGAVTIRGREEKDILVLTVCCDCAGLTGQQIGQTLELEGKRQGSPLARMDQSLRNVFGKNSGITAGDREDGLPGREMQIRLPLNGGSVER